MTRDADDDEDAELEDEEDIVAARLRRDIKEVLGGLGIDRNAVKSIQKVQACLHNGALYQIINATTLGTVPSKSTPHPG